MNAVAKMGWAERGSWPVILVTLLPLWLLSVTVTVEGFPDPPVSFEVAAAAFVLALAIGVALVWARWMTLDLVLYSLFPLVLVFIFDEISTSYKTPFILACALVLSVGIVSAQRSTSEAVRWQIWLVVNIAVWVLASHALQVYWNMVGTLVFGDCFPYTRGCPPLAGTEIPWWVLFFLP